MDIAFNLSVDDEIVTTEHVWRTEWVDTEDDPTPPPTDPTPPPKGPTPPPSNPTPPPIRYRSSVRKTTTILDEEVPLADSVDTGDESPVFVGLIAASILGLGVLALSGKRKQEKA